MKNVKSYEVSLVNNGSLSGAGEILKNCFVESGVGLDLLVESVRDGKVYVSVYVQSSEEAYKLKRKLKSLSLSKVRIVSKVLESNKWQNQWKKNVKPFKLTDKFDVVPLWHLDSYKPCKREPIYIDTVLAFGTGLHETTRFMSMLIEKCKGKFAGFFDIGTGTGILAIVALKCSASKVVAVDIDPGSIEVAKKNIEANQCIVDELFSADLSKMKNKAKYDFVAANLVTDDLIRMKKKIISFVKKDKYLAVSGISIDNLARFKSAFKFLPVRCIRILKGKEWAAILYKRI